MKLDCVLTACNANPLYLEFIPIFVRAWKKLYPTVDVKIILISDTIPEPYNEYKNNIVLFHPIPYINDAYVSQIIRLLYPGLLTYSGAVLITDIDMLPMNRTYYSESIAPYNNKFIHFRNGVMNWRGMNQYAMCYNAAAPSTWREITGMSSIEEVQTWIISNYCKQYDGVSDGQGWYSDQVALYNMLTTWGSKNLVCLKDEDIGHCRLDRIHDINLETILPLVKKGHYSDYHCLRPYAKFKSINDAIIDNLPTQIHHAHRSFSDGNYGTHIHPLTTAVLNTTGPVLELGCGDFSTPILHEICKQQRRHLLSCDTSKEWIELFLDLESSMHTFKYVPVYSNDWDADPKPHLWNEIGNDRVWSVVFIDHRPAAQRKVDIARFASNAEIIVVHDTEESGYEYESVFPTFKYRFDYMRYAVRTTLVSNTIDVRALF
jgi:hypothetical protein